MFSFLSNLYYGDTSKFDYKQYYNILDYLPVNKKKICEQLFDKNDPLVVNIKNNLNIFTNNNRVIVSLSGGVDSMVLITILKLLNVDVIALHIDYNNRVESNKEKLFLEKWCQYNNIKFYEYTIESINRITSKRTQYEIESKKIRFNFYREIMLKENVDNVLLAHHKDDVIENIFANVCRGRNILDLAVLKPIANVNKVNLVRPLLNFYKSDIYEFADKYHVPYFKDSTPIWSVRGKYRLNIETQLINTFSENVKENLLLLSYQSDSWNYIITDKLLKPFLDKVEYNDNWCKFNVDEYKDYPTVFWSRVFSEIFNRYGKSMPGNKAVATFANAIYRTNVCYISLSKHCKCKNVNNKITISFNE